MNWNKGSLFLFASVFWVNVSWAEVDLKDLKGSHEFFQFQEECSELAPHVAFNLIRQGMLNQVFLYGDPSDPKIQFIQMAFNSVSENPAFFQVSPLARNIAVLLPPSTIGKVIHLLKAGHGNFEDLKKIITSDPEFKARIAQVEEEKKAAERKKQEYLGQSPVWAEIVKLENELESRKKQFIEDKKNKNKELRAKHFPNGEGKCSPEETKVKFRALNEELEKIFAEYIQESKNREATLVTLKKTLAGDEILNKLTSAIEKFTYQEKNLDGFIQTLVKAYHFPESKGFVEKSLVAIGSLNAQNKKDFLSLYQGLPRECFKPEGVKHLFSNDESNRKKREQWLNDHFKETDYHTKVTELLSRTPSQNAEHFLAHPDDLTFLSFGRSFLDPNALPTMGLKQVDFTHPVSKEKVSMPDCMEYAILNNMLNALAGGPGNRFDVDALEKKLKEVGYTMHPGLKEFLTEYPDPSRVNELPAHRKWAQLVSGLSQIKYNPVHPTYEIVPTVSNALELYHYLLFHKKNQDGTSDYSTLTRAKKLDLICKVLSREGRTIDWKLQGAKSKEDLNFNDAELKKSHQKDTDLVFEFTINERPKYDWSIKAGHSQVDPRPSDDSDWRKDIGIEMAKKMKLSSPDLHNLAWFLNTPGQEDKKKIFAAFSSHRSDPRYQELLWCVPMESKEGKLFVVEELLKEKIYAPIEKIGARLPNDAEAKKEFQAMLADHYYPFKTTKTYSGAEYKFIPSHPILGKSWQDPRGKIWGETFAQSNGEDQKFDWESAKKACLNLNKSEAQMKAVEAALKRIESNEELIQLRTPYVNDSRTIESKQAILMKYHELTQDPIPGCYLPLMEDWLQMMMDFGHVEHDEVSHNQYVPQFLAKFVGRWFWTSTASPPSPWSSPDSQSGVNFSGSGGAVNSSDHSTQYSVRCVCPSGSL